MFAHLKSKNYYCPVSSLAFSFPIFFGFPNPPSMFVCMCVCMCVCKCLEPSLNRLRLATRSLLPFFILFLTRCLSLRSFLISTSSPNVFFFVLLPPILLQASYSMRKKNFFSNFSTIMLFAVIGTLISTILCGFALYGLGSLGTLPLPRFTLKECLMFGALISATDPVATLSIMGAKDVNANHMLYSLVFGESVLNDAVGIVLFDAFDSYGSSFTSVTTIEAIFWFMGVTLGSLVLGVLMGLSCSFILKHYDLRGEPSQEFIVTATFAYAAYCAAEVGSLSGVMCIFFCGVTLAHYNWYNISKGARATSKHGFDALAIVGECRRNGSRVCFSMSQFIKNEIKFRSRFDFYPCSRNNCLCVPGNHTCPQFFHKLRSEW
jgi:NhaP-type Na+/H+ or K+/H+ antiporter